jgi:hypothetical protein
MTEYYPLIPLVLTILGLAVLVVNGILELLSSHMSGEIVVFPGDVVYRITVGAEGFVKIVSLAEGGYTVQPMVDRHTANTGRSLVVLPASEIRVVHESILMELTA